MTKISLEHDTGDYTISVTIFDFNGLEGPTETLSVSMPKNKSYLNTLFLKFLENVLQ